MDARRTAEIAAVDEDLRAAEAPCTVRLLHAEDVASQIGMTPQWVYRETRRGLIPHIKLGRYYRYRSTSIDEWLAASECGARALLA